MPRAPLVRRLLFAAATSERWEQTVRVLPLGERLACRLASRYVAGCRFADALACADGLAGQGLLCSLDLFGESIVDPLQADHVTDQYVELTRSLHRAPNAFLSIDLSHIGLDEAGDVGGRRRLEQIAAALPPGRRLQVGAEQARRCPPDPPDGPGGGRYRRGGFGDSAGKPQAQPVRRARPGRGGRPRTTRQGGLRRGSANRMGLGRTNRPGVPGTRP